MFLLLTISLPNSSSLCRDNPHFAYNKESNCPRDVISKDKFMVVFWLLLDLRGLREGNISSIPDKLSEWK